MADRGLALRFVQFMHPGEEPALGEGLVWNQGPHRRKFLRASGTWFDGDAKREGQIVSWGEWEPESRADRISDPLPDGPRQVFTPFYRRPTAFVRHQNTDPFVFGPRFIYSNCQQRRGSGPSVLQRLDRGSVILFGSHRQGAFVLDTVFVVADRTTFSAKSRARLEDLVPAAFLDVTIAPLLEQDPGPKRPSRGSCVTVKGAAYTLYRGATIDDPVEEMYSFVPCLPADEAPCGFARPRIRSQYVSSGLTQNFNTEVLDVSAMRRAWLDVRQQVIEQGCRLGVRFDVPPRVDDFRVGAVE